MGILLVNVCWQVFSRYVLKDPQFFTDELARYLLIWLSAFRFCLYGWREGTYCYKYPFKKAEYKIAECLS